MFPFSFRVQYQLSYEEQWDIVLVVEKLSDCVMQRLHSVWGNYNSLQLILNTVDGWCDTFVDDDSGNKKNNERCL